MSAVREGLELGVLTPDRVIGFAVVARSLVLEEWCIFAQGVRRDLLDCLRERLEILGIEARVVDCELLSDGEVQLFSPLVDPDCLDPDVLN